MLDKYKFWCFYQLAAAGCVPRKTIRGCSTASVRIFRTLSGSTLRQEPGMIKATRIFIAAIIPIVCGHTAAACPWHGEGAGVDASGQEVRHTLVVRVTDHLKNVTKGFVPDAEPLDLPEAGGFRCRIETGAGRTAEGLPVYVVSCRDRVAVRYNQPHDCGGKNAQMTPGIWNGSGGAGMTTMTLAVECI
jgi:hypothetical protein